MRKQRQILHGYADGSHLRTDTLGGKTVLVTPVVALMEGVVQGSNAEVPEFVSAAVLAKAPGGWNGEPVTWAHPLVDGLYVSANIPDVLEQYAFGQVFHAHMDGTKLKLEAWLDPETTIPEARAVIDRLQRGEIVEISVGAFVLTKPSHGVTPDGVQFQAEWLEVIPDHLALLPEGVIGACSVEMGCGTRVMAAATESAWTYITTQPEEKPVKTFTRKQIFANLLEVFGIPSDSNDNQEVTTCADSCDCGTCDPQVQTEGADNMDKTARIDAILADASNPFTDDEREFLAGLSDDRLAAFETEETSDEEVAEESAEESTEEAEETEETAEEEEVAEEVTAEAGAGSTVTMAQADYDRMRADAEAFQAHEATTKQGAVDRIAALTDVYTPVELQAFSTEQLSKLEKAIATSGSVEDDDTVVSYEGRKLQAVESKSASANPPRPWDIALEERAAG